MKIQRRHIQGRRAGLTLIEVLIASSIFAMVLLGAIALVRRDGELSQSTIGIAVAENRAQALVYSLGRELADAAGFAPSTQLTGVLSSNTMTSADVLSTVGFPDRGVLIVDRGTGQVERIGYDALGATSFGGLSRGLQCTDDVSHAGAANVLWAGVAEVLALQTNPPASSFDGRALMLDQPVFFRGDGAGFSYRVPVDPTGSVPPNYVVNGTIQWGAEVPGAGNNGQLPSTDGWHALAFVPSAVLDEAVSGVDVNSDGDATDLFDVGQIRRQTWNMLAPGGPSRDLGLGPTIVLQERCNWGGDLDGDGFEDPIFLWDPASRELQIRLFVVGSSPGRRPIVRRVEALVYLRNPAQST